MGVAYGVWGVGVCEFLSTIFCCQFTRNFFNVRFFLPEKKKCWEIFNNKALFGNCFSLLELIV